MFLEYCWECNLLTCTLQTNAGDAAVAVIGGKAQCASLMCEKMERRIRRPIWRPREKDSKLGEELCATDITWLSSWWFKVLCGRCAAIPCAADTASKQNIRGWNKISRHIYLPLELSFSQKNNMQPFVFIVQITFKLYG